MFQHAEISYLALIVNRSRRRHTADSNVRRSLAMRADEPRTPRRTRVVVDAAARKRRRDPWLIPREVACPDQRDG
jgi:hypothetical protein